MFSHFRLCKIIKDRVKSLDEALQTRDQLGESIQEATDWLDGVSHDLKKIPRTVGPTVNEAEDVLKKYEVNTMRHIGCEESEC